MARHIFTVCVVCLLCAHHLPCVDHLAVSIPKINVKHDADLRNAGANSVHNPSKQTTDSHNSIGKQAAPSSLELAYRGYSQAEDSNGKRRKRHVGHSHNDAHALPELTERVLKNIMREYSKEGEDDPEIAKMYMNEKSFQRFLLELGLSDLADNRSKSICKSDKDLVKYIQSHGHSHSWKHHDVQLSPVDSKNCTQCSKHNSSTGETIKHDNQLESSYLLSKEDLLNIFPVMLYQIASKDPRQKRGCLDEELLKNISVSAEAHNERSTSKIRVWVWSALSVLSCSLLGLLGIAIIPIMDTRYYKAILDYLVSLAVGTLSGDALMHLFPHAVAGQDEKSIIYKGFASICSMTFFFAAENVFTLFSEKRKSVEKKKTKRPPCAKVVRDPDSTVNNAHSGERMCKQKYSSYPYCYDELNIDNKKDVWMHVPNNGDISFNDNSNVVDKEPVTAAQALLSQAHSNCVELNHPDQYSPTVDINTISTDLDCNVQGNPTAMTNGMLNTKEEPNETVTVILREHESVHHGHTHRHGHVHSPPKSVKSVAWMIIMGDGLHNLTDGMAIGAAFSENIAGGFSTAVAVFCHELPHELGDFALLIKAGMTVKVAAMYNLLTSLLSFIGMAFGILYGQTKEATQWMFAVAAGLFIYIALVDMMPEISTSHKSCKKILRQVLGIATGVFIMLLIAIYEGQISTILPNVY